ncbi:MAG: glycoside hydrolase family protein [Anaerocolumna sp.]|nr:glycoside hydrolase family protein [Anaerocolumna sp.]
MYELLKKFNIRDSFFDNYETLINKVVIPYQEKVLKDEIKDVEKSHAIENFIQAAKVLETGQMEEEFYGMVFQDSDVAKWLEAAAYSLLIFPDEELEKRCDEIIDIIEKAQHRDGYLNTYFTIKSPEKRWTNLHEAHELYCAGHLMEAAVAYSQSTGKKKLLNIMCRMADHIYKRFIIEKAEGYPGHPEVELALMRMYRETGNENYLELAKHFINVRGVDSDYFVEETRNRDWYVWHMDPEDKENTQNHAPVREQKEAVGHAVRAVYLYTGMADLAATTGEESLIKACEIIWENLTKRRMYVTGAIGSAYEGETFTKDYHLPNDTAYAETCAAIGLIFFARKMIDLRKDSKYADVMERALYNGVLAGMQLDGKKFFYVNPLEVIPGISGEAKTHKHALPIRPKWYACACCPPNVARLLPSIASYAWCEEGDIVYSNLFIGGTLDLSENLGGKIQVETAYPNHGTIQYRFKPNKNVMNMTLAVRVPSWSENTDILFNGDKIEYKAEAGYVYISSSFKEGDVVTMELDMEVKRIFAKNDISENNGKVAFSRGPLIYCCEGVDNQEDILSLRVKKDSTDNAVLLTEIREGVLAGIIELTVEGYKLLQEDNPYSTKRPKAVPCEIKAVPYYVWGNRGLNQMRVWMPEA